MAAARENQMWLQEDPIIRDCVLFVQQTSKQKERIPREPLAVELFQDRKAKVLPVRHKSTSLCA